MKTYFLNGVTIIDTEIPNGASHSNTGHLGVYFDKSRKKYAASICVKRKHYNLGYFTNIEDAVAIRKEAEKHRADGSLLEWRSALKATNNCKGCATK